ncbi:hypothetical protein ES703_50747 [subsurface metagenome]
MTDKITINIWVNNVIKINRTFRIPSGSTFQLFLDPIRTLIGTLTSTKLK